MRETQCQANTRYTWMKANRENDDRHKTRTTGTSSVLMTEAGKLVAKIEEEENLFHSKVTG